MIDAGDPRYRLRRDGTGDNTQAFAQIMADALATQQGIALPPGRYQTTNVSAFSGLTFEGENRATTTIALHPSSHGRVLTIADCNDVIVRGITFDGQSSTAPRDDVGLVSILGGNRNQIEDFALQHVFYIGLELGYTRDVAVRRGYFTDTGKREVTIEGGAAIWMGEHSIDHTPIIGALIEDCLFEDLEWSPIYSCPQMHPRSDVTIIGNTSRRTKESAFFLYGFERLVVLRNTIEDVMVKSIAACGIESGGTITASDNKIRNTQAESINLKHCINATVERNECTNGASFDGGGITHLSMLFETEPEKQLGPPRNSIVTRNIFDGGKSASMWFAGQPGAPKASSFIVSDNVGLDGSRDDGGIRVDPAFQGERFFVSRNLTSETST